LAQRDGVHRQPRIAKICQYISLDSPQPGRARGSLSVLPRPVLLVTRTTCQQPPSLPALHLPENHCRTTQPRNKSMRSRARYPSTATPILLRRSGSVALSDKARSDWVGWWADLCRCHGERTGSGDSRPSRLYSGTGTTRVAVPSLTVVACVLVVFW
jgi:hypothetical protein